MPGSVQHGKEQIKKFFDRHCGDVKNIVDVGPGAGAYRTLLGPNYYWVGVEIFEPYVEMFKLKKLYNEIMIGDISKTWPPPKFRDLIIFGDVLEHLPKNKAIEVLDRALAEFKHVIVSIPIDGREGKVHYGNEAEKHISEWTYEDVEKRLPDRWLYTLQIKGIGVFCK